MALHNGLVLRALWSIGCILYKKHENANRNGIGLTRVVVVEILFPVVEHSDARVRRVDSVALKKQCVWIQPGSARIVTSRDLKFVNMKGNWSICVL